MCACWSNAVPLTGALLLIAVSSASPQVPVLAPQSEACCITPAEYFRLRDSLVVQLVAARVQYQQLRDSVDKKPAKKPAKVSIEAALGPGIFYDFKEGKVLSGFGLAIGLHVTGWKVF